MIIGLPKENRSDEARVSLTPESVRKLQKKGNEVKLESSAGVKAGFPDEAYTREGARVCSREEVYSAEIVVKVHRPSEAELKLVGQGSLLISFLEPYLADAYIETLARLKINALAMELIPRTSRAQSMDALSSQANIAGYRAVLEGACQYGRFFPLMMTSAGSAKAARVMVLGAGVAGLQAIATARRLGAMVEAYDVRTEVKEQILSLGAKFVELEIGEEGAGQGGYAKELSETARIRQKELLTERLKKCDLIISTANIPGRKAPLLITREAVEGMRAGSVIVDMAAASGGNCECTEANQIVNHQGVKIVGITNYPALLPADSSNFYGHNLVHLINLLTEEKEGKLNLNLNLSDDIIAASLVSYQGQVRLKK